MNRLPFVLCATTALTGCLSFGPEDNVAFGEVNSVHACEGVYRNRGEGSESGAAMPVYLSEFIWPSDAHLDHAAIASIEFRAVDDATLSIKGLGGNLVVKQGTFVQGRDFDLESGRIRLSKWHGNGAFPVMIGSSSGSVELGLDQRGDGKLRKETSFAGLIVFVPMAADLKEDVRFVRIGP